MRRSGLERFASRLEVVYKDPSTRWSAMGPDRSVRLRREHTCESSMEEVG